jgi:hypothetical protein
MSPQDRTTMATHPQPRSSHNDNTSARPNH